MSTPEHKTYDRRAYMRQYKAKQYEEDPDKIKTTNRSFYYKYKFRLSAEDMKQYGDLTPEASKAIDCLNKIRDERPELLQRIFIRYATA